MGIEPSSSAKDMCFGEVSEAPPSEEATSKDLPVLGRLFRKQLRRSVYGRTKITSIFKQLADEDRQNVRNIFAARKESGGNIAMSTDAWKRKGHTGNVVILQSSCITWTRIYSSRSSARVPCRWPAAKIRLIMLVH